MNKFPWQTPYMHSRSMGGDDQIEALQTDVMRFMAILGLCLMAIFSIVQSLPYQPVEKTPQLESKELLEADIKQLQVNLSKMLDEIEQLDNAIQKKQETKQQLDLLEQAIENQRGTLSELNKELQQEQKALSKIRKKLKQEQRTHKQHQKKLEKLTKTTTPNQAKPQKKGFSLRFASDQVLLDLLKKQQINLFLMMGKHTWKLSPQKGNWQVTQTKLPKEYYQMAVQTVPTILRQTIKKKLSVQNNSQAIWAVELPGSITSAITQWMKDQKGGELIIEKNGHVKLI